MAPRPRNNAANDRGGINVANILPGRPKRGVVLKSRAVVRPIRSRNKPFIPAGGFSFVRQSNFRIVMAGGRRNSSLDASCVEEEPCPGTVGPATRALYRYDEQHPGWRFENWVKGMKKGGRPLCLASMHDDAHVTICRDCDTQVCRSCVFDDFWAFEQIDNPTFAGSQFHADVTSLRRRILCGDHWKQYLANLPQELVAVDMAKEPPRYGDFPILRSPQVDSICSMDLAPRGLVLREPATFCECRSNLKPLGYNRSEFCIGCGRDRVRQSLLYRKQWQGDHAFDLTAPCAEAGCTRRVPVQVKGQAGLVPDSSHNLCSWCFKIVPMHPWDAEKEAPATFPDKSLCAAPEVEKQEAIEHLPAHLRSRRGYRPFSPYERHIPATDKETLFGPLPKGVLDRLVDAYPQGFNHPGFDVDQWGEFNEHWIEPLLSGYPVVSPIVRDTPDFGPGSQQQLLTIRNLVAAIPAAGRMNLGMIAANGRAGAEEIIRQWVENQLSESRPADGW